MSQYPQPTSAKPSPQMPPQAPQPPYQHHHAATLGPAPAHHNGNSDEGRTPQLLQQPAALMVGAQHHHPYQPQQWNVPQPSTLHHLHHHHAQHHHDLSQLDTLMPPHSFVSGPVTTPAPPRQPAAASAAFGHALAPPTYTSSSGQLAPAPPNNAALPPPSGIASLPTYQHHQPPQVAQLPVWQLFPSSPPFQQHHSAPLHYSTITLYQHQHQHHHHHHHHAAPAPAHGKPADPKRRPSTPADMPALAKRHSIHGTSSFASSNDESTDGGLDRMLRLKQQASDGRLTSEVVLRSMRDGSTRSEIQLKGQAHIILHVVATPVLLPPYCDEATAPGLTAADFFPGPLAGQAPRGTLLAVEVTQMRETPTEGSPHPDRRLLGCFVVSEVASGVVGVEVREAVQPAGLTAFLNNSSTVGRGGGHGGPPAQFLDRKPDRIWLILRGILSHTPEHVWAPFSALRLTPNLCVHRELATAARGLGIDAAIPSTGRVAADVPMSVVLALRRSFERQTAGGAVESALGCSAVGDNRAPSQVTV